MIDLNVNLEDGHLCVVARGSLQVKDPSTQLDTVVEAALQSNRQALLIDARAVQVPATLFLRQLGASSSPNACPQACVWRSSSLPIRSQSSRRKPPGDGGPA